ncbi:heat shock 70 kDa protein 12B-like [Mytilus californianus]|uniref:heat shock 70 kDa protein 12B-like n=1 Tax=Mytilus californianus TaxID=6549 RepID=UPI0022476D2D|nr:heat shock 70 kDa protein 12B-like [Mytilus californianus]
MATNDHLLVAALDFGTTYSGYAFSMRHEFKTDPLKIHANQAWNSGGRAFLSLKTPTCLLLNAKKQFIAFGYDAENQYADIVMDDKQDEYFYFHRFKMNLHNNKNISAEMVLEDILGKPVSAVDVFSLSIKALVDHFMDSVKKQGTGVKLQEIQWVLTIPAIWTDSAKQFMRECAEKAGIPAEKLLLALEPETASIFCQYLPTEKLHGANQTFAMSAEGTKYMVADLGGGTADMTVHEKTKNGRLKELHRASGNDCGGTSVDGRFFQMLVKILGGPLMKKIKDEDPSAYLDLFREFEAVKRTIETGKTGKVNIAIPYASLDTHCMEMLGDSIKAVIASCPFSNQISLRGDKMRIDADLMIKLFKPTIDNILSLMYEILQDKKVRNITQILLVGGFSECRLIQDAVVKKFGNKKVIIPEEAGLSVLKGAVLFGHKPDYVQSRVMRFTYGVMTTQIFDPTEHDEKYREEICGQMRCKRLFAKFVAKNEEVEAGTKKSQCFLTVHEMQKSVAFEIFVSTDECPVYTDEDGCTELCKMNLDIPDPTKDERAVDVEFVFGNTEIGIRATDRISGNEIKTKLNLI